MTEEAQLVAIVLANCVYDARRLGSHVSLKLGGM